MVPHIGISLLKYSCAEGLMRNAPVHEHGFAGILEMPAVAKEGENVQVCCAAG